MASETIEVATGNGSTLTAYLSTPGSDPMPGLIICSEAFGVNSHMRSIADRFAQRSYAVVVPDLFWRIEPRIELPYNEAGLKRASEIADTFDKEKGVEDLAAIVTALRRRRECNGKVGILGFCIGGAAAYLAAARLSLDAMVSYYGKGIEDYLSDAASLTCPSILHYAGADRFIPPTVVARVRTALAPLKNIQIFEYPGVDHGFNSEDRRAYNPEVAKLAMERTLDVLNNGLR